MLLVQTSFHTSLPACQSLLRITLCCRSVPFLITCTRQLGRLCILACKSSRVAVTCIRALDDVGFQRPRLELMLSDANHALSNCKPRKITRALSFLSMQHGQVYKVALRFTFVSFGVRKCLPRADVTASKSQDKRRAQLRFMASPLSNTIAVCVETRAHHNIQLTPKAPWCRQAVTMYILQFVDRSFRAPRAQAQSNS